jgi:hypothetical protein
MARRIMILAAISSLLPVLATCQRAAPTAPSRQPWEELQNKLDEWQHALQSIDIDRLPGSNESHSLLLGRRDTCLVWLRTLTEQGLGLQREHALSDQARLLLEVVNLQNAMANYSQELRHAYQASDAPDGRNASLALKWMNQTAAIVAEVQRCYESLEDTVMRNMDDADRRFREGDCKAMKR